MPTPCQQPSMGDSRRPSLALTRQQQTDPQASVAELRHSSLGHNQNQVRSYRRRLVLRMALCLVLGLVLAGTPAAFVAPPKGASAADGEASARASSSLLRGAANAAPATLTARRAEEQEGAATEAEEAEAAALRARVAELEKRLAQGMETKAAAAAAPEVAPAPAPAPAAAAAAAAAVQAQTQSQTQTVSPVLVEAFEAILRDLPEVQELDENRMGMTPDKQYVFAMGNTSMRNPIYKRKYEVLGNTLRQQDSYLKLFGRTVRKAKKLESVQALLELQRNGGGGLTKKEVKEQVDILKNQSRLSSLFFRDLLPDIMEDPLASNLAGLLATFGLIFLTLLLCVCFFPPILPQDAE